MRSESTVKPGPWIFVLGGVVLTVGMVLTVYGVVTFLSYMFSMGEDTQQFKAPGNATITVDKPATILIYQEWMETPGRQSDQSGAALRQMTCVARDESEQEIAVGPVTATETYQIGKRKGISVWQFEAPTPGSYTLDIQAPQEYQGEIDVAAAPSMLYGSLKEWLTFFVALFGGIAADTVGGMLIVIGLIMRSRSKSRQKKDAAT